VRLCAEDPAHDFLPQAGRMMLWRKPQSLRIETALESGSDIAPFYDSMIAKIIAHGASREDARRRLVNGLAETVALGVTTNLGFLLRALEHKSFVAGLATTAFIGEHRDELLQRADDRRLPRECLAAVALYVTERGHDYRSDRRLVADFARPMRFSCDGRIVDLELSRSRDGSFVAVRDAQKIVLRIDAVTRETLHFRTENLRGEMIYARAASNLFLSHRGETLDVRDLSLEAATRSDAAASDGRLRAAMAGRVVAVLVKPGDRVEIGQPVVTLEAMKMEHIHTAPIAGIVAQVHVRENEQVSTNKIVVEIEAVAAAQ